MSAPGAKTARERKRRGGDKIVAVRTPKPGEMANGKWSRIRKDDKPPSTSKYGKGRGYGPPRKPKHR